MEAAPRSVGLDRELRSAHEAYARILHPACGPHGDVRWADLAGPSRIGYGFFGDQGDSELVRLQHRDHYLFAGPLARMARPVRFDVSEQSPSMWWPSDRAWFVATEVDGYSTYVGGTRACIDAILASPDIEAIPVAPETAMDPGPYR